VQEVFRHNGIVTAVTILPRHVSDIGQPSKTSEVSSLAVKWPLSTFDFNQGKHFPWKYYNITFTEGSSSSLPIRHSTNNAPYCAVIFRVPRERRLTSLTSEKRVKQNNALEGWTAAANLDINLVFGGSRDKGQS
jgi:hypothetical protein